MGSGGGVRAEFNTALGAGGWRPGRRVLRSAVSFGRFAGASPGRPPPAFPLSTMIVKQTLPNGLTLLTEQMPHVRSVAIGVWVKSGSRHETAEHAGIPHLLYPLVFNGTHSPPP